jgi:hypothetical protein
MEPPIVVLEGDAENVNDSTESVELRWRGEEIGVDLSREKGFVVGETGIVRWSIVVIGGGVSVVGIVIVRVVVIIGEGVGFAGAAGGGRHGCFRFCLGASLVRVALMVSSTYLKSYLLFCY